MKALSYELRYAIRRLRSSPMFTTAAALTLALAIGATASVFALVDGVLLKSFPLRAPSRILTLYQSNPVAHLSQMEVAPANYLDWQAQSVVFSGLAAAESQQSTVTGTIEPERARTLAVTPDYFAVLGIRPALGRVLAVDSSGPPEVVIGHAFWQRRFGSAPAALGRTITIDERPYTIVGVMPAGVLGPFGEETALWRRLRFTGADQSDRSETTLSVYGRLKPGVTRAAAERDLELIAQRLARAYPEDAGWSIVTIPLLDVLVGRVRPALFILLGAATCLLLIGAANLANLFLVRCLGREREMAVRTALGATRNRILRELTMEATVLGLAAGVLSVGVAAFGVRLLRQLAPSTLPRLDQIGVDGSVIAFCAGASIVTMCIFGLVPAWKMSRTNVAEYLKEGGRGTGSTRDRRLQSGLVVLQVAVALILLAGAALLAESFKHFEQMDPGFRSDGVLTAQLDLPTQRYSTPERQAGFIAGIVQQLGVFPAVLSASASDGVPAGGAAALGFAIVGDPAPAPGHMLVARTVDVTPEYFRTMGIRLLHGRGLRATDNSRSGKVALVDELMAHRFFGNRDPLDRRLAFGADTVEIVGVVPTVKQRGLANEDLPGIYRPFAQFPGPAAYLEIRFSKDPRREMVAVQRAIGTVDPTVPISDVQTMTQRLMRSVGTTRFSSALASVFAGVALILGLLGVYSVLAYIVSQRRREIGVRLALGASRARVVGDVLRRAFLLAGTGILLGLTAAWALTRVLAGLVGTASAYDPGFTVKGWDVLPTFVGVAVAFALVAIVAACVPALRAARVSPATALTSI